ncbi:hypothetical protein OUZ56_008782 [Daphnia magna]|uniref:Uncharacterized protein n=1 Tax=Daphnia magna TaxID=35525 RepID=A0ABR0AE22_9CRUS|nr:hypothetical protein OUZ56_008782 [Daphnia magna]
MHCCLESHVSPSQHRFLLAAADFDGAREQELITGGEARSHMTSKMQKKKRKTEERLLSLHYRKAVYVVPESG